MRTMLRELLTVRPKVDDGPPAARPYRSATEDAAALNLNRTEPTPGDPARVDSPKAGDVRALAKLFGAGDPSFHCTGVSDWDSDALFGSFYPAAPTDVL
jgi:hypothetical protein